METTWKAGLEDVIAARSAITAIDGAAGRLYYRGYEIGDLAGARELRGDDAPPLVRRAAVGRRGATPSRAAARGPRAPAARARPPPHAAARTRTRSTPCARPCRSPPPSIPTRRAGDAEANLRKALRLMTLVPAVVAAWQRIRTGREPGARRRRRARTPPTSCVSSTGRPPAPEVARVLDTILTLHADHELNASTFAARVAVATLADLHAAVVGRHRHAQGAAPRRRQRGRAGDAARDRRSRAGRGVRRGAAGRPRARHPAPSGRTRGPAIPGFGHRVYRVDDARARVLRRWRRRWPRRPGTPGSSRSPSASTRR